MIRLRNRYFLLVDALAVVAAAYSAFAFRFGWLFIGPERLGGVDPDYRFNVDFFTFAAMAVVIKLGVFTAFGVYRQYWRYAGFPELIRLVLANTVGVALLSGSIIAARFFDLVPGFSRAIPPLDWLFCLALTVAIRASVRALGEAQLRASRQPVGAWRRVLIVGAGDAGTLMAREMKRNPQLGLLPVGFLDDDSTKVGKRIYSIEVLGHTRDLGDLALQQRVDEVVIAIPTAPGAAIRELVQTCQGLGLPSKVIPGVYELLDGQLTVSRLREVEIGDLLRRPQVATTEGAPVRARHPGLILAEWAEVGHAGAAVDLPFDDLGGVEDVHLFGRRAQHLDDHRLVDAELVQRVDHVRQRGLREDQVGDFRRNLVHAQFAQHLALLAGK